MHLRCIKCMTKKTILEQLHRRRQNWGGGGHGKGGVVGSWIKSGIQYVKNILTINDIKDKENVI